MRPAEKRLGSIAAALGGGSLLLPLIGLLMLGSVATGLSFRSVALVLAWALYVTTAVLLSRIAKYPAVTRVRIWIFATIFHAAFILGLLAWNDFEPTVLGLAFVEVITLALCGWGLALALGSRRSGETELSPGA
jgi:hypothetical protein